MLLFPRQRSFSFWFALLLLPFWSLVFGSAALAEATKLFILTIEWIIVPLIGMNIVALIPCFLLLMCLACRAHRISSAHHIAIDKRVPEHSEHSRIISSPGYPLSPHTQIRSLSWLIDIALLMATAYFLHSPITSPLLVLLFLFLAGLLFLLRGGISRLTFLWVLGTICLAVVILTVGLFPPVLWKAYMLTSYVIAIWGTFLIVSVQQWRLLLRLLRWSLHRHATRTCKMASPADLHQNPPFHHEREEN